MTRRRARSHSDLGSNVYPAFSPPRWKQFCALDHESVAASSRGLAPPPRLRDPHHTPKRLPLIVPSLHFSRREEGTCPRALCLRTPSHPSRRLCAPVAVSSPRIGLVSLRTMGRVVETRIVCSGRVYACRGCGAHLAKRSDVISKAFHGRLGPASLIERAVNVRLGPQCVCDRPHSSSQGATPFSCEGVLHTT